LRNDYSILVGKPKWTRPLGRPRLRWEDNITVNHRVGGFGLDASDSGYGPVVDSCENGVEPPGSMKGGEYFQ
jgi:hypothetical protein